MAAEFINLLDSYGSKLMDSVSTSYEDSFSLEEFGDLIKSYTEADPPGTKGFIIARVQTWDYKQPDRAFYSYYDEYHLNKILFQTQIYLGKKLIHRLHVLNPLTNSDIIGNVLYFKVVRGPKSAEPATQGSKGTAQNPDIIGTAIVIEPATPNPPPSLREPAALSPDRLLSPISPSGSAPHSAGSGDRRRSLLARIAGGGKGPTTPVIAEEEHGVVPNWTLTSPVVSEVTEEEGNANAKMPFPNRRISLVPNGPSPLSFMSSRRHSYKPLQSGVTSPAGAGNTSTSDGIQSLHLTAPDTASSGMPRQAPMEVAILPVSEDGAENDGAKARRRTISYDARMKRATGTLTLRHRTKSNVPKGIVTQFAVPVPEDKLVALTPTTPPGRRRTLSFANAVSSAPVPVTSPMPPAMKEWVRLIRSEEEKIKIERQGQRSPDFKQFSQTVGAADQPANNNPASPTGPGGQNSTEEGQTRTTLVDDQQAIASAGTSEKAAATQQSAMSTAPVNEMGFNAYEAILIGTDNDYLESSRMRATFKDNALRPEDVQLFEMPEFTGQPTSSRGETSPVIVQEQVVCDSCYPTAAQLAEVSPAMRAFHVCKCYLAAATLLAIVFALIYLTFQTPKR